MTIVKTLAKTVAAAGNRSYFSPDLMLALVNGT